MLAGDSTKKTAFSLNSASFFGSRRGGGGEATCILVFLRDFEYFFHSGPRQPGKCHSDEAGGWFLEMP